MHRSASDRPAPAAGGGLSLGSLVAHDPTVLCTVQGCPLWHMAPAVIWCASCDQPADGDDEQCPRCRAGLPPIPAAITDPWLRRQWALAHDRR